VLLTTEQAGDQLLWIAQCLELDIAAQAKTIRGVQWEFQRVLAAHFATAKTLGMDPFDLPKAPSHFWDQYSNEAEPFAFRRVAEIAGPWAEPPSVDARVA
jgi:hypothetical protein